MEEAVRVWEEVERGLEGGERGLEGGEMGAEEEREREVGEEVRGLVGPLKTYEGACAGAQNVRAGLKEEKRA